MRALDPVAPNAASAAAAITALNIALAGEPSPVTEEYLNTGPWYQYNPSSPESLSNPENSAITSSYVTDNFVNSFMPGDTRAANVIPAPKATVDGFTGSHRLKITDPTNSALLSAPLPMIRNAEFILLRAQAEIATGDLVGATRDINATHTVEGGLAPYATFTTSADAIRRCCTSFATLLLHWSAAHGCVAGVWHVQSGVRLSARNAVGWCERCSGVGVANPTE